MSQIETVIRASKQLEQLLEQHYAASGRGLHEKTSSIEDQLDPETVRGLRKIATLRNKVVHEDFEIDDLVGFQSAAQQLVTQLQPKAKASKPKAKAPTKAPTKPAIHTAALVSSETTTTPPAIRKRKSNPPNSATPRPQSQPRVQLPSKQHDQEQKNRQLRSASTRPDPAKAPITAIFPAISGLLIFLAIIWILAR